MLFTRPKFANDLSSRFYLPFYSYIQPVGLFYLFMVPHYKNSLSSLHILVHHCTFCASLHVKTSPGVFFKNIPLRRCDRAVPLTVQENTEI